MNNKLDKILAEISAGELIDKITILEIKKIKIADRKKLEDVEKELSLLNNTLEEKIPDLSKIHILIDKLKAINLKLWDIENGKRMAEKIIILIKSLLSYQEVFIKITMKELESN